MFALYPTSSFRVVPSEGSEFQCSIPIAFFIPELNVQNAYLYFIFEIIDVWFLEPSLGSALKSTSPCIVSYVAFISDLCNHQG